MKKILCLICITILGICVAGCDFNEKKYDKEFREYLNNNYNLVLNERSSVNRCYKNCDYYGYYIVNNDYNYIVQISKTKDTYEVSYDEDAINKRSELYQYIKQLRGNDIAPNYLGFYANTYSGHIQYSSGESTLLYYIIKYNANMNFDEELKKDYEILQKAQSINESGLIREMIVAYVNDDRLNDEEWVLKTNVDVGHTNDIIYSPEEYLNKYAFQYRISNYDSVSSLASLRYTEFEDLVKSKLQRG